MAKESKEQGGLQLILIVLAVIVAMAVWVFISSDYLLKVLSRERTLVVGVAGRQADQWIYSKMIETSTTQIKGVSEALNSEGARDAPQIIKEWVQERIIATWLWSSLIVYRANTLLLFWFILMPFTLVIVADGFDTRLIRTFQFSSQSPIRHRMGVVISMLALFIAMTWLVLPIPIPTIIAPLVIVSIGLATWMWTCNLQKRI